MALPLVLAGVLGALSLVLLQSHASARSPLTYSHLTKIQKRIISGTLANYLGAGYGTKARRARRKEAHAAFAPGNDDNGPGADGAPNTPPSSYGGPGGEGSPSTYFPSGSGQCSVNRGDNVKVNQNCLNITDPDLQGRGQANNEPSIAVDPFNRNYLVASDNNYYRGDGTCGAHYSTDGGHTWNDTTVPNGFTRYPPGSTTREYWQAGGDTSVGWDTRGNAYLSCQLFNRGTAASPNQPDQSSAFVVFRSTQNHGASFNFPGRYTTVNFDAGGTSNVLEDKALMAIDDNPSSPYRDRIYVTWTEFAADGTAYIYEVHSDNYGESFSNRVLVSEDSPLCTNTYGLATPNGRCNENTFSDPFIGPNGDLYVVWNNYNNPTTGNDNRNQILLAKSTDGGNSFSPPVKVSDYYDLPDCQTYQGDDFGRACVPEKGSSTKSVFRALNYASGRVDPRDPNLIAVTVASYINKDSNESNGCIPNGFNPETGDNLYTGVKTPGACNNKILLSVSTDGGATFSGASQDPRTEEIVPQSPGQRYTDQWWQWTAFTQDGTFAVDYYDRQYGDDETTGYSDFTLSESRDLVNFDQQRVTSSSMPPPTEFYGTNGGLFYGDYVWLDAAGNKVYPIWSDTRSPDLFLCPGTATGPGNPPQLCEATETNGERANDEDTFMAVRNAHSGYGYGH